MGKKQKPTQDDLEVGLRCSKWFARLLEEVADASERSVRGYIRHATAQALREMGLLHQGVPPIPPLEREGNTERVNFFVSQEFHKLLEHGAGKMGANSVADFVRAAILAAAVKDGFDVSDVAATTQ
jgi:uncharacterized protein (DUF1778 family)